MMPMPVRSDPPGHAHARAAFLHLLGGNPNYFGNLTRSVHPPVTRVVADTTYEEIRSVAVHPTLRTIHVSLEVKRPSGYRGSRLDHGSVEHLRLHADLGSGWVDLGATRIRVFNDHVPDGSRRGGGPASRYVVSVACASEALRGRSGAVRLRAILAWEVEPPAGEADWLPVWGNVVDEQIWLAPSGVRRLDIASVAPRSELPLDIYIEPTMRHALRARRDMWSNPVDPDRDPVAELGLANVALFVSAEDDWR
jgi:hypothetical protein